MVARARPNGLATVLLLVTILGAGTAVGPLLAEVHTAVTIDAYNTVAFDENGSTANGLARGELDFESVGSNDVRSRLQIRTFLTEIDGVSTSVLTVPRAEIRWRMNAGESFRMRYTVGRSRLSWGDGVLYNAADTINGARPGAVDLTADTLRDETQWLLAGYVPLGRFAFLEPVLLLPGYDLVAADSTGAADTNAESAGAESTAVGAATLPGTSTNSLASDPAWHAVAGGRIQFNLAGMKTELGYLYRGEQEIHQPSIALQGNLVADLYLGASLRLPDAPDKQLFISGGVFYTGNNRRLGQWSARAESLWEQEGERLSLHPELTWAPSQLFSVFIRGQLAPVEDASLLDPDEIEGVGAVGFSWTPTTGLTLSLFTGGRAGRTDTITETDTVSDAESRETDPAGSITLAASYAF